MSNWYDADASFKQTLLVIMTKAQNQKYFVGGGLFEINIGAFVSVRITLRKSKIIINFVYRF